MIPTLTRSALTMPCILQALATVQTNPVPLDRNLDLTFLDRDGICSHAQAGRGETLAGHDVELDAMPGTGDDLPLTSPGEFPTGRRGTGRGAIDRAFTERAKLVGANIG